MNNNKRRIDTICFGGQDWWYHHRAHIDIQLMRRFARMGTTLYVNSIVMQKPTLQKNTGGGKSFTHKLVRKTKSIFSGLKKSDAGFWVYSPFTLPVNHISWARSLNESLLRKQMKNVMQKLEIQEPIIWVVCPVACNVAVNMKKAKLIYLKTDVYEEFPNVDIKVIREHDKRLKANADLTIFVSRVLYDEESGQCRKAIYLDHGVDFHLFASVAQDPYIPEDVAEIPKPIVGFFGEIADYTVDLGLIEKVIDYLPGKSFVFVGEVSVDCSRLAARENVWMLGKKPYEKIPHYGKCFDVAIMPWQQNRWIELCNPIKLKEYLALGKPVVSTPFTEVQGFRDVVHEARNPEDFAEGIRKALVEDSPTHVIARRKKVQTSTWDSKAELVLNKLFER
jgi:glycosyltransferase involved in cell wall biosynthesis